MRLCGLAPMPLVFNFSILQDKNYEIVNFYSLTGPEEFGVLQTCSQAQTSISWNTSIWNKNTKNEQGNLKSTIESLSKDYVDNNKNVI